jgi:hypothetical protein
MSCVSNIQGDEMTDEEILDEWHAAKIAHQQAAPGERDAAFLRKEEAERQAIGRFGLGRHLKVYGERFPEVD